MILPRRFGRETLQNRLERIIGRGRFVCCSEKSSQRLRGEMVNAKVGLSINNLDLMGGDTHV